MPKTKTRTLICKGPPSHPFQAVVQRGRPPKLCPEHKAGTYVMKMTTTMTVKPERNLEDRFRLVPTQGRAKSWFVWGATEARADAERSFKDTGVPVLIAKFPEDGVITPLCIVGPKRKGRKR